MNQIAPNVKPSQKSKNSSFHVGSTPQTNQKELNSCRLNSLNEALSDALKGENYEQAAWLRDQINSLMENTHE
ncbi:MAG: UvrB/UvrC motif-containing protein, partial [Simkania sp.]|nr:UvrB/UvrC motif-containing protein [Simkania sp.]